MEIRIAEPADAATIIPYLLGYQPKDTLTFLAVQGSRMVVAGGQLLTDDPDGRQAAHQLAHLLLARGMRAILLVGYGSYPAMNNLIEQTVDGLTEAGLSVLGAIRVDDNRIWHVGCGEPNCKIQGQLYDPAGSTVAATATFAGLQVVPDRETLEARLAPVTGAQQQAMQTAISQALRTIGRPLSATDTMDRVETLIADALQERLCDARAAQLLVLLAFPRFRDHAVGLLHHSQEQIQVWTDLTRRAGAGRLACTPATLLALTALLGGDGITAGIAAERATAADPDEPFARLVEEAVLLGLSPQALRDALRG